MKNIQNVLLIGAIITHYMLVGADAYAQASIVPVALSAPPASLAMYQGEYVYNPSQFWQITNAIALILLVVALVSNWRTERRNLLIATLAGTIIISVISLVFIFPEYTAIINSAYSNAVDPALFERGASWRIIALSRLIVFSCLGFLPLWALTKPGIKA